jgi:16S rRNA (cytidine1402-2'-O)-methyltransferase
MLYITATPIGNLDDITLRALATLQTVGNVIAENPAHSQKLFKHFNIEGKKFFQFADHNEEKMLPKLLSLLASEDAVLVSDAGTPAISDPGFRLVRACVEAGIEVSPLPGPVAAVSALSASGLPTDKFLFAGFLPKTEVKVLRALEEAKNIEASLVFYESPQRIQKTIDYIAKWHPDCKVVIARELTKLHEEFVRGTASKVKEKLAKKESIKGEITVIISFK